MEIKKVANLAAELHGKTKYVIHLRNLKQTLSSELVFKKVHKMIKFNQNAWLKPCIDMNTDLRKEQKLILKKIFLITLMNKAVLGKTI